jgi:hypothetical protein
MLTEMLHPGELAGNLDQLAFDSSSASSPGNPGSGSGHQQSGQRTKRMRTSFKHHQLRTMKSYFAINQNPDAKDLKQLAQKTGLSKRVLQVSEIMPVPVHCLSLMLEQKAERVQRDGADAAMFARAYSEISE